MQHFPADLSNSRCWRAVLLCAVSGAAGGCDASSRIPSSISITSSSINLVMGQQPVSHCTVTLLYYCHCILWSNRMPEAIFYIYLYLESQIFIPPPSCIQDFYFYETKKSNSYNANIWLPVSLHRNTNTLHGLCSKYWFDSPCAVIDELLCQHIPMVIIAKWGAVSRNPQEVSIF